MENDDNVNHPVHGSQWREVIHTEFRSLIKNKTWRLIRRPSNRNIVIYKWVFKYKKDQDGNIIRFKARLIARGFTQIYGIDYLDTFAPVAKLDLLRILLAITAIEDLEVYQMDVVTVFLIGEMDEEIYME
jgi:hypothetical protein